MKRRSFALATGAVLLAPRALLAQAPKRVYRIATLDDAIESARAATWKGFRSRLAELGLVEGRNVLYESRYALGKPERLPGLAAELVASKPDMIVTAGTPPTIAAIKATSSIPVVFIGTADPVGSGIVASLARPGGNVTGISTISPEVTGKQLELLREVSPGARRYAFLVVASNKASVLSFRAAEDHARTFGVTIRMLDGLDPGELERSFETITRENLQGLIVGAPGPLLAHRDRIVAFAAQRKLPVVYQRREYVDAGGLLSYGWDLTSTWVRGADLAHRILNGASPADTPVERPTNLRMVLNAKTARALGIRIPTTVRARADEVIE